ncbi:helix-turn-helix domain-containing protein [Cohnella sp. CFH 77786]|uniref:AraC family transcriptional regulator n=1 Tax=Cohnella sp. CFH 77786 TaxID=2662265 RepID=UPI001C60B9D7|nr:AraC family transcriptional regulator [Cohnella sp. CFH 77786]MBW5447927.1 helix-turn-helix domain-containing protein [Cohnella sp. CFH 77786]
MSITPTYRVVSNPVSVEAGQLTVLFAGESQTKPGHRVGPKVADYFLLHHVTSGCGIFRLEDFEARLGAGDTFLIPPNQLASYVSDEEDPWQYRWVAFTGASAAAMVESAGLGSGRPVVSTGASGEPAERCRTIYETFLARNRSASLEAAGHLLLLLASLQERTEEEVPAPLRPSSHSEELVGQIIDYLSAQYAEPVTIEGMAEALGYNRAYLSRLFKARTGLSPATFLTRHRVDRGRRLLRERPELTIEQVASSVGFQDPLYFSKQFKRWHGQSPTDYRAAVARFGQS